MYSHILVVVVKGIRNERFFFNYKIKTISPRKNKGAMKSSQCHCSDGFVFKLQTTCVTMKRGAPPCADRPAIPNPYPTCPSSSPQEKGQEMSYLGIEIQVTENMLRTKKELSPCK